MEKLDRYELREVLGTGAFATVWRAHDPMLGTDVAIKLLADNWARDAEIRQRFLTEARLALEATSPHLVRVHHVAESADRNIPYIVMSLATGGTLETRLRAERVKPRSASEALVLTREIAVAVAALHDLGLLHRDLKPANVLFHTHQGQEQPILGDFGLARSIDRSALTLVGGTPTYAAPEQAAGLSQLTKPADLFPLGIMFLEMITGDVPHHATMVDAATKTVDVNRFLRDHDIVLDTGTYDLVSSLLDPAPQNRPIDAHDLIAQIDMLLNRPVSAGGGVGMPAVSTSSGVALPLGDKASMRSGRKWMAAAGAAVVVPALLLAAFFSFRADNNHTSATVAASPSTTVAAVTVATSAGTAESAAPEPTELSSKTNTTTTWTQPSQLADLILADVPVPSGAVIDRRATEENRFVYNIAGGPENLVASYKSFTGWDVVLAEQNGTTISLVVTDGNNNVVIEGQSIDNTAGVLITRLTITPAGAE